MKRLFESLPRWLPALFLTLAIFAFSSRRGDELPDFQSWDYLVKKAAHAVGYGLLALSYLRALPRRSYFLAWLLAVSYSATDEFHQSFVPGRHAAIADVVVFDNLGALAALIIHRWRTAPKRQ